MKATRVEPCLENYPKIQTGIESNIFTATRGILLLNSVPRINQLLLLLRRAFRPTFSIAKLQNTNVFDSLIPSYDERIAARAL